MAVQHDLRVVIQEDERGASVRNRVGAQQRSRDLQLLRDEKKLGKLVVLVSHPATVAKDLVAIRGSRFQLFATVAMWQSSAEVADFRLVTGA